MVTMISGVLEAVQISGDAIAGGTAGEGALIASTQFNIIRGAILGALVIGFAFLGNVAIVKRSALAFCAVFMVGTAMMLELFWLSFLPLPHSNILVLLQGLFAASVIIFLSAGIKVARQNAALGGMMFAGALVFIGVGLINMLGRADFSMLMLRSLIGVGVFAFVLSLVQSFRGDHRARQILPGAILALASIFVFNKMGGGLAGHGVFTIGLLVAGLVALTDNVRGRGNGQALALPLRDGQMQGLHSNQQGGAASDSRYNMVGQDGQIQERDAALFANHGMPKARGAGTTKSVISGERLVDVLDFSGIGVWDWSLDGVYQSRSLCGMLGADCEAEFTPQAMRAFIEPSHLGLFEQEVLGHNEGDGGFDVKLIIHNGYAMRVRGARAIDKNGRLERVVAFFEKADGVQDPALIDEDHKICPMKAVGGEHHDQEPSEQVYSALLEDTTKNLHAEEAQSTANTQMPRAALSVFQPIKALGSHEIIGYTHQMVSEVHSDYLANFDQVCAEISQFLHPLHAGNQHHDDQAISSDVFVALPLQYGVLSQNGVSEKFIETVRAHNFPHGSIVLELSDLKSISDVKMAKVLFADLHQAGIRLAFADSRADKSVLGGLHRYNFDYIRIDGALVSAAQHDTSAAHTMRTLMTLGRDLGLRVIADGLDDKASYDYAQNFGCTYGQGQLIAAPIAADYYGGVQTQVPADVMLKDEQASSILTTESLVDAQPEEAVSLDDWQKNTGDVHSSDRDNRAVQNYDEQTSPLTPPVEKNLPVKRPHISSFDPVPVPSIEAAFAQSVPSFTQLEEDIKGGEVPSDNSLPKWRTWGKKMR